MEVSQETDSIRWVARYELGLRAISAFDAKKTVVIGIIMCLKHWQVALTFSSRYEMTVREDRRICDR